MSLPSNAFRANVGAVVINEVGLVLALERSDIKGAWQMPQGGMNEDEEPLDAVKRELREETTIAEDQIALIAEHSEWLAYELPKDKRSKKHGRGQVQKWFLFRFTGNNLQINLDHAEENEFSAWKWMKMSELTEKTVPFRRTVYNKIADEFSSYLAKWRSCEVHHNAHRTQTRPFTKPYLKQVL